jgi:hypothetical protein
MDTNAAADGTAMGPESTEIPDLELNRVETKHLINDIVHHFSWRDVNVKVKDRNTKHNINILESSNGIVHAGVSIISNSPLKSYTIFLMY